MDSPEDKVDLMRWAKVISLGVTFSSMAWSLGKLTNTIEANTLQTRENAAKISAGFAAQSEINSVVMSSLQSKGDILGYHKDSIAKNEAKIERNSDKIAELSNNR